MPLLYQQNINDDVKLAVWHIKEDESFFLRHSVSIRPIRHPLKRLQHLAGRYLLKELFPDFPFGEMEIAASGKPYLLSGKYHFSISHSNCYAAAIVGNTRVGIDVEQISGKAEIVRKKFLTNAEEALVTSIVPGCYNYTLAWSVKEALYKYVGKEGIDFINDLRIIDIQNAVGPNIFAVQCNVGETVSFPVKVHVIVSGVFLTAWCYGGEGQ